VAYSYTRRDGARLRVIYIAVTPRKPMAASPIRRLLCAAEESDGDPAQDYFSDGIRKPHQDIGEWMD